MDSYTCADCGGTFQSGRSNDEARAEAIENFGASDHASGMAIVCDDCYKALMTEYKPLRTYLKEFMNGIEIAISLIADAERIEREKHGQALLPEEADTVKAVDLLRKIAPYLFVEPKASVRD